MVVPVLTWAIPTHAAVPEDGKELLAKLIPTITVPQVLVAMVQPAFLEVAPIPVCAKMAMKDPNVNKVSNSFKIIMHRRLTIYIMSLFVCLFVCLVK